MNKTLALSSQIENPQVREQMSLFTRHRIRAASVHTISPAEVAMETEAALKIVRMLASGVNPETGEALPPDSIYRKPPIVKALNRALAALVQLDRREKEKPANTGKYWSKEEDTKLCEELRSGLDFRQIAREHHRSVGSIVARLVKLGEIASPRAGKKAA